MMVRMYESGDARLILAKSLYDQDKGLVDRIERASFNEDSNLMLTFLINNYPVACFGCGLFGDGTLEWWAYMSEDIKRAPIYLARTMRRVISRVNHTIKPKTNYLLVYAQGNAGQMFRSAEVLGFKRRGFIKQLKSTGLDYWVFERAA